MKNKFVLLMVVPFLLLTSFQEKGGNCQIGNGYIFGKIVGENSFEKVQVACLFFGDISPTIKLSPDLKGNFKLSLNILSKLEISISYQGIQSKFFISPGDSIYITIDKTKNPEIVFSGKKQLELNNYYHLQQHLKRMPEDPMPHYLNDTPDQYLKYRKSQFNADIALIKDLCNENSYSQALKESSLKSYAVKFGADLLIYLNYAKSLQHFQLNESTLSPQFKNTIDSIFKVTTDDFGVFDYHNFLFLYSGTFAYGISDTLYSALLKHDILSAAIIQMDYYLKNFSGIQKDYLVANSLRNLIDHESLTDQVYARYVKMISCDYFIRQLKKRLPENKKVQSKEFEMSKTILNDISQSDTISMIWKIKNEHKNRIQYVDIWATWCGPCISNFAYSPQLKKELSKYNIDFVYIAVSSDKQAWEKIISDKSLEGYHYLINDHQQKDLKKLIHFSTIPRYFIVGKSGIIIDENAKAPNDPELIIQLKQLSQDK